MNAAKVTAAYSANSDESYVLGSEPNKLVVLLYQGALLAIAKARYAILKKDAASRSKAIAHAIRIIQQGLQASLDKNVGGELAHNLDGIYSYMIVRLASVNQNNDIAVLDEVSRLLDELKGAWETISKHDSPESSVSLNSVRPPKRPYELVHGKA